MKAPQFLLLYPSRASEADRKFTPVAFNDACAVRIGAHLQAPLIKSRVRCIRRQTIQSESFVPSPRPTRTGHDRATGSPFTLTKKRRSQAPRPDIWLRLRISVSHIANPDLDL
jgi:hypothetical protein